MLRDSPLHNTQIERTYRESMTGHYYRGSRWSSSVIWSIPIHYSSRSGRQRRLGFSSQRRDPGTPSILMSKREMPCGIVEWITREWKNKKKSCGGGGVSATRTAMNQQQHCKSNHYKSGGLGGGEKVTNVKNTKSKMWKYYLLSPPPLKKKKKQMHTDGLAT